MKIRDIHGDMAFDSRGEPTVRVKIMLQDGTEGIGIAPSGASTGSHEARELRDGGDAYSGRGVHAAVENVNAALADVLRGAEAFDQGAIDAAMIEADDTPDKHKIGANAMIAASWAVANAAANALRMPLYRYLGGVYGCEMPCPMFNVINGGRHADNNLDIQEFMFVPCGAESFHEAMRMGVECRRALGTLLHDAGHSLAVGDEGGFAPNLNDDAEALDLMVRAIELAGWRVGEDVGLALDAAASEWLSDDFYVQPKSGRRFASDDLIEYYTALCARFPILSIEDPLGEDDFDGFRRITDSLGDDVMIVGDDLFTTNPARILRGAGMGAANAALIKPNQIGTVSETLGSIRVASENGYAIVVSHRSGDTEDASIADLAVAVNAGFIKSGAPVRSERLAKYNRLLMIEDELNR